MTIDDVKSWLDEAIDFFTEVESRDGSRRDIQENIKNNRKLFGVPYRKREEIKAWVLANKPAALPLLTELKQWFEEWYQYFQIGYRPPSGETIDTLPKLILDRLIEIRTYLDTL